MNKNVNHANLTISHHATGHFSIHSSSFLASKWEWIITSGWNRDWYPQQALTASNPVCVPLPCSIRHHPCIIAVQHLHTQDILTQQYRWQSCPHTGKLGRNMMCKSCRLEPVAWLLACLGIYSASVMSVWLIGTTIGAHVLRAVYSTHQAAGTPGLEVPWVSTQRVTLNGMNKILKLFSLEHTHRRKDWRVFMFVPAGKNALDEAFTISCFPLKHLHTWTKCLYLLLYASKGRQNLNM